MARLQKFMQSLIRIAGAFLFLGVVGMLGFYFWEPGSDVQDGRHDHRSNAIWIAHGWLGADEWFVRNQKTNQLEQYRSREKIQAFATNLRERGISDVFPHLCPSEPDGRIAAFNREQVERFLDGFEGFRVLPWIGGPNRGGAEIHNPTWRIRFVKNVRVLLLRHKRLAGVHLNVEPLPNGDADFLLLLDELHAALPPGKILSVAAYPPPTRWHPFPEVHWDEVYFRQVAKRCDQMAVMMYDAGQKIPKTYQDLMANWTEEVLNWSEGRSILLGVPSYDDLGTDYHYPEVENMTNALRGIHAGLLRKPPSKNFQGIAIYCDWETSAAEWEYLQTHFSRRASQ